MPNGLLGFEVTKTATAGEMIEALKRLPPDTALYAEGGCCPAWLPEPEDVITFENGDKGVIIA